MSEKHIHFGENPAGDFQTTPNSAEAYATHHFLQEPSTRRGLLRAFGIAATAAGLYIASRRAGAKPESAEAALTFQDLLNSGFETTSPIAQDPQFWHLEGPTKYETTGFNSLRSVSADVRVNQSGTLESGNVIYGSPQGPALISINKSALLKIEVDAKWESLDGNPVGIGAVVTFLNIFAKPLRVPPTELVVQAQGPQDEFRHYVLGTLGKDGDYSVPIGAFFYRYQLKPKVLDGSGAPNTTLARVTYDNATNTKTIVTGR